MVDYPPELGENLAMPETEFSTRLRRLVETIDIANMLSTPILSSIRSLLDASAAVIGSADASVLIRDENDGDLRFLTAVGSVAEQLSDIRIPAGKGIAGFVFSSGQPMAVADVGGEESFYAEVDKRTGYSTQMLLATPLRFDGDIIGVLEYVNRRGQPPYEPFTPDEMDRAAIYSDAVASLVNAYSSARLFSQFSDKVISSDHDLDLVEIQQWLAGIRSSDDQRERLELAAMLYEVAERGFSERQLCRDLLDAILRFSNSKSDTSYLNY
jgi:signal transduction protein with GAF and PtsI domain